MNIYIDEAGNFIIPTTRANYISCVVGLIVPSGKKGYLFDGFLKLRTSWGSKLAEIKGSSLNEKQVAKVIQLLAKYDALAEIFAIDGSAQSEAAITNFKQLQADKLTEYVGPDHHPNLVDSLRKLQDQLRRTSNQLFVQAFLTTSLCEKMLQIGTLFWSQRVPQELGEFVWTIDAKDKRITEAEEMWRTLLMPFLEARSFSHPLGTVDDPHFDYTYFEKFAINESDEAWKKHFEWLREVKALPDKKPVMAVDINTILRNLTFANSQDEIGLQLADIVANAFHRACKGTLQKEGWRELGSLFVRRREAVVNLVAMAPDLKKPEKYIPVEDNQVADVLVTIRKGARSMSNS